MLYLDCNLLLTQIEQKWTSDQKTGKSTSCSSSKQRAALNKTPAFPRNKSVTASTNTTSIGEAGWGMGGSRKGSMSSNCSGMFDTEEQKV